MVWHFGSVSAVLRLIKSITDRNFDELVVTKAFKVKFDAVKYRKFFFIFKQAEHLVRWPSLSYRVVSDVRVLARANGEESNKCPIEERFIQVLAALILLLQVDRERKILRQIQINITYRKNNQ